VQKPPGQSLGASLAGTSGILHGEEVAILGPIQAVLLALIQGLTEFLPVSSSGHLVLGARLLGLVTPGLSFSIWVHAGTGFATVVMLYREISWLVTGLVSPELQGRKYQVLRVILLIVLASVPAGAVGLFFEDTIQSVFSSGLAASLGLLFTGFYLRFSAGREGEGSCRGIEILETVDLRGSVLVGLSQAVAIIPGVSRSGTTITTGLLAGMSREDAARFSFLLSLPAVFGALLLDIRAALSSGEPVVTSQGLIGALVSFVAGLVALGWVFRVVRRGELSRFSYYCWALGLAGLTWFLLFP